MQITTSSSNVRVIAPYNPGFIAAAKRIGGKWQAPAWSFDIRDEDRVRALCMEHYGEDGRTPVETRTVRVQFVGARRADCDAVRFCGREIGRARGRDSGATLGDGIVVLEGEVASGGSVKNWATVVRAGAVVLIRDVPTPLVEKMRAEADGSNGEIIVSIEDETPPIDVNALTQERARLRARLAEIDAILARGAE